jgi:hypothetical protein
MPVRVDAPSPQAVYTREQALRVVCEEHRAKVLGKVGLIERAIAVLDTAELGEQLRGEAQHSAHMLSGR